MKIPFVSVLIFLALAVTGFSKPDHEISELLVGKWAHFEKRYHCLIHFKTDGSFTQTEISPQTDKTEKFKGTWTVEGGKIVFVTQGSSENTEWEPEFLGHDSFLIDDMTFERQ